MSVMLSGWVWTPQPCPQDAPCACRFRKVLKLAQAPRHALCRITADSRYLLLVNGVPVCRGPRKGDDKVWFYEELDLSPFLHAGENVLAAVVLRYPQGSDRGNRSVWRMALPALAAAGEVELEGGPALAWQTDASWKAQRADDLRIHGDYAETRRLFVQEDARGEAALQGWQLPDYDDSAWPAAAEYPRGTFHPAVSPAFLRPRPIPLLYETPRRFSLFCLREGAAARAGLEALLREDAPLTLPPHTVVTAELSAARLTTGYLELAVSGGAGGTVKLLSAEGYCRPDATQGTGKGDRLDSASGVLSGPTDRYTVGGYGTPERPEAYEPFWFRAFRFVRVRVATGDTPLTLHRIAYRETGYPLTVQTQVETSDPSLAAIWTISENSLRACMHETYEDCPAYEQLQYLMDTRAQALYTYAAAADDRLGRQAIDDFARSQRADGLLNGCYPAYKPNVIPGFSIYYILMLHDHMLYFGDAALVRRYLPTVERILAFFDWLMDEALGLVQPLPGGSGFGSPYWGFVDWAKGWEIGIPPAAQAGPLTMDSLLYCLGLAAAEELAAFAGRTGLAAEYRQRAMQLREGVRRHCAGRDGMLQDGPGLEQYSQHVQVFAALTGTLTGPEARRALERTLGGDTIPQCTVAMGFYLFRALEQCGLYAHTGRLWDKWRAMLADHLTTCVESDGSYARSDCHAWGALALYELPAAVLGVRPAAPGWAKVRFAPSVGTLTHASGQVITPKGLIRASWALENGALRKHITLPDGMEAEVVDG